MYAVTRAQVERSIDHFLAEFSPKYDKTAACLAKERPYW
jgi:hypothetical protein